MHRAKQTTDVARKPPPIGAIYTLLATALPLLARILLLISLSKRLGPYGQGVFSHAATLVIILVVLLGTGVGMSFSFFTAKHERRYLATCWVMSLLYSLGIGCSAAILFGIARRYFPAYFAGYPDALAALLPLLTLLSTLYLFQNQILAGQRRFAAYFWINVSHSISMLSGIVIVDYIDRWSVSSAFAIWILSLAVVIPWQAYLILTRCISLHVRPALTSDEVRTIIAHGSQSSVATVADCLLFRSGLLILRSFAPFSVLGVYAVALSISELLLHLPKGIGVYVMPTLVSKKARVTHKSIRRFYFFFLSLCASGLSIAIFVTFVPSLLGRPDYSASVHYTWILLPGTVLMGWAMLVVSYMRATCDMKAVRNASLFSLAVVCIANILLIPTFHAYGASLAATFAFTSYAFYSLRWFTREAGQTHAEEANLLHLCPEQ